MGGWVKLQAFVCVYRPGDRVMCPSASVILPEEFGRAGHRYWVYAPVCFCMFLSSPPPRGPRNWCHYLVLGPQVVQVMTMVLPWACDSWNIITCSEPLE